MLICSKEEKKSMNVGADVFNSDLRVCFIMKICFRELVGIA